MAFRPAELMRRLTGSATGTLRPLLGPAAIWVPLLIAVFAGLVRFWGLDHPHRLIFDETYYVKDGYSMLHWGYERQWPKDIDNDFVAGNATPSEQGSYVVHPPLGKWIIALGMAVFGTDTGTGWRAGTALAGTLAVLFTTLAAQRLFRSVALGAVAGVFMAIDGQQLVLSRTGILDIFVTLFVSLALWLALLDRAQGRRALARAVSARAEADGGIPDKAWMRWGPALWWRPWRLLIGVSLGALCSIKWSGLAFVAVFGLLIVWWDAQARRAAGIQRWLAGGIVRDGLPAIVAVLLPALATYLLTWIGWFLHPGAYGHGLTKPENGFGWVPQGLRDLVNYHLSAYAFHQGLSSSHSSASNPWTWPVAGRPVPFLREYDVKGEGCDAPQRCVQVITDLPNPLLWWAGIAALLVVLVAFLGKRDWRALTILSGFVAGWVPWLFYPDRTMFFFYTSGYQPYLVLAVVYCLALLMPRPGASARRVRQRSALIVGLVAVVVAASWFFWPIWTGQTITDGEWTLRSWLPGWNG